MLVTDLAPGTAAELGPLRAACRTAIRRIAAGDGPLVALGSAARWSRYSSADRGSLAGFGVPIEIGLGATVADRAPDLPVSLTVGAWLVHEALGPSREALAFSVGPHQPDRATAADLRAATAAPNVALLVLGDGTARRSVKAPGYLDARAEPFDAAATAAMRSGDPAALEGLDADLGVELLAAGVPAWRVVGRLLAGNAYDADLLYDDDPYGVAYHVAVWTVRG